MSTAFPPGFNTSRITNKGGFFIVLLIAPILFGQAPAQAPLDVHVTSATPYLGKSTVTLQELRHAVPKKAQKEMDKAENARSHERRHEAIDHLNRAISIDPEFVAARNNLAVIYLTSGDGKSAVAQLEEAAKVDPHNPTLFTNLTLGYTAIHNFDAAERAARTRLALDGTSTKAHLFLGLVLLEQRKFTDEALRCFERARDEHPLAHLLAGRLFMAQGDSRKARSELKTYLSIGAEDGNRALALHWLEVIDEGEQKSVTAPY